MIDYLNQFRESALSLPGTEEASHFDRIAFKVTGKRIFATLHEESTSANVKLTPADQTTFSEFGESIYPVPNKWGEQGWTTFELIGVPPELVRDALQSAHALALRK